MGGVNLGVVNIDDQYGRGFMWAWLNAVKYGVTSGAQTTDIRCVVVLLGVLP